MDPSIFDLAENINREYDNQKLYSVRNTNSRRHTFSFDFMNANNNLFGFKEERKPEIQPAPPARNSRRDSVSSRKPSIDVSKFL